MTWRHPLPDHCDVLIVDRDGVPHTRSGLLVHLIDTGAYKQIATNWYFEKGMIDKPVINGAIS